MTTGQSDLYSKTTTPEIIVLKKLRGAGEGHQRLKPDGSMTNMKIVKTDTVLPAYCQPPNPCPIGYTADDGCLEQYENSAAFSREYQQVQICMCDSEHMFDCPGSTRDNELDALARSFENEGFMESTLDRFFQDMEIRDGHKIVAKKFSPTRHSSSFSLLRKRKELFLTYKFNKSEQEKR
ncbi:c-terminal peptide [Caerostris extrusa]|uniref:Neuroendocrine protein 7B2 n=1 Tax=Caerostris extrusa TaxID=172846 RepID=A0AAV4N6I5_CAEEX|nr:c-terminal peptide [Caerostris extrusa]